MRKDRQEIQSQPFSVSVQQAAISHTHFTADATAQPTDLTVRTPPSAESILFETASCCLVSAKILPDGWAVIFSHADNPVLEIARNFV